MTRYVANVYQLLDLQSISSKNFCDIYAGQRVLNSLMSYMF